MFANRTAHTAAVLQALFVTFLWSTSWVLIKWGLEDIPALPFAGLRYLLAFLCLLPFAWRWGHLAQLRALSLRDWLKLSALGLLYIAVSQGAQFLGLSYLPAVTVSLLLNFTPAVVALLGILLLAERPTRVQWAGIVLYLAGTLFYFFPMSVLGSEAFGMAVVVLGVLTNAISAVLGRQVNREKKLHPIAVTVASMGVGSVALLLFGVSVQGVPTISPDGWLVVGWLAVVNTAFAFPLWNHTLRTLSAVESSIINSTMLVQIALLAWLFLGEELTAQKIGGMIMVGLGMLIVQLRRLPPGRRGADPAPTAEVPEQA
ncbi:MAG TPA: DMT family transporter [Chloroflexia bacterium]|nr:DMT family transporter [Chloroflexia bacterium]